MRPRRERRLWRWCSGDGGGGFAVVLGELVVVMKSERGRGIERREIRGGCGWEEEGVCEKWFMYNKKTNPLLLADCRPLVHLFSCRCLQMWSTDCRPFGS
ncbi:hypothetical protein Hanom_Chr12g01101451 [Helianthus anomalus]